LRAVLYARYSTDLQSQASIEDQFEVCRRYVENKGWQLSRKYNDAGISGASALTRPGFQRLLLDAQAGLFDIVVTEAIDRLGRNLADVAGFHDRLTFSRIQLHAVNLGLVTPMHVGLIGMMAQMQLKDMGDKTRRGLLGRARAGKSAGGLAFGYDIVPPRDGSSGAGERIINREQADVVVMIFQEYAAGRPPRTIAAQLNRRVVPGPGGRVWGDTTIRGQVDRGTGILNNSLYIGQLVWNRCSYIKDPNTGKRVARPNRIVKHEVTSVPALRIIDDALWQRVKDRQIAVRTVMTKDANGNALNRVHRRKFLFSGLLLCGCCGARFAMRAKDYFGCSTFRSKGNCANGRLIKRERIETRVLSALQAHMLTPVLVEHFVRTFEAEVSRRQKDSLGTAGRLKAKLDINKRKLQGVLSAIENGAWNESLKQRLDQLELEKRDLTEQLLNESPADNQISLHPNAAGIYAAKVADLRNALDDECIRLEASEALAALIEKVVLTPDDAAPDGLSAELFGDLATILALATSPAVITKGTVSTKNPRTLLASEGILSVVAGVGFEPTTFRL
jgi:site-specific DNA recombinase